MEKARVHLKIHGRVQGVFFRDSTRQKANSLGATGWVKNRNDGSVEAVAEGERETLEEFVQWCRQGPPSARVTEVEEDWQEPTGEFTKFSVIF